MFYLPFYLSSRGLTAENFDTSTVLKSAFARTWGAEYKVLENKSEK